MHSYLEDFVKRGELVGITPGKWDAFVTQEALKAQEGGGVVTLVEGQLPAQREGLKIEAEGMIAQGEGLIAEGEALVIQAEGLRVQAEGLMVHGEGMIAQGELITGKGGGANEHPSVGEEDE